MIVYEYFQYILMHHTDLTLVGKGEACGSECTLMPNPTLLRLEIIQRET